MSIDDLRYTNAIDGVGDFEGLTRRFDYLAGLGVTRVWLQPGSSVFREPRTDGFVSATRISSANF